LLSVNAFGGEDIVDAVGDVCFSVSASASAPEPSLSSETSSVAGVLNCENVGVASAAGGDNTIELLLLP
jgi:hypothetical protein